MAESGNFIYMTANNSHLYTKTYTPSINSNNRFYGSGFINFDDVQLQYLSGEDLTEIIKMGAVNSEWDGTFWTSDGRDHTGSATFDEPFSHAGDYDIAMNRIDIIPTGQIIFGLRQHMAGAVNNIFSYGANEGLSLWAKKNNNPGLSGDILIGRYNSDIYYNDFDAVGIKYNRQIPININEGGRSSWLPLITSGSGLVINASGRFETSWWESMPPSGKFNIYGMEITVSGTPFTVSGAAAASNFDIYTAGHLANSGNFDLIAFSEPPSGNLPLYMSGSIQSSGNFNIFIEGKINSSGSFDSYIYGHDDSNQALMMVVKSPTLGSGLQGTEMTIVGPNQLPYSGIIPMVVYQNTSPNMSMDMFIQNNNIASNGRFNMFIQAPSGTYGAVPWSGVLPMYVARDSEGIDAGINLYIGGPSTQESGFNMFVNGANLLAGQLNMSISGGGPISSPINLFTHGF
jgi:hypothetical protein